MGRPTKEDRGKQENESKLARRRNRGKRTVNERAEYESLNHEIIVRLIDAVAGEGGTVTFGTTRDGGAYYISYYHGGEVEKHYIRPNEDPNAVLANEIEFWTTD